MQQSMTGYGRDERTKDKFLIKTEVQALNHKFFDLTARYGKEFSSKEIEIRNMLSDKLKRGKIMLTIELLPTDAEADATVDDTLFHAYYQKFNTLSQQVEASAHRIFEMALQAPEVIKQPELNVDEVPWEAVFMSISAATDQCENYRKDEGNTLVPKLSAYINLIGQGLKSVESSDETRTENIRSRLQKNLDHIREKIQVDENRFEQELIYYIEKIDITEEKVRLGQHLKYFQEIMQKEAHAGKKLGFISQEIGREINTIGSKANDAGMQRTVVMMKDELEKIKEQVLNIL